MVYKKQLKQFLLLSHSFLTFEVFEIGDITQIKLLDIKKLEP